jgi:non-ribosomal peptide synthetase component E (peptide arylation enzyme)
VFSAGRIKPAYIPAIRKKKLASIGFYRHAEETVARFTEAGFWRTDTLSELLDEQADATPDKMFVQEADGRAFTFRQMERASVRFANAVLALGLKKGDVVAIQLPSSIEFLIAYFGVTRMGGILATLHMPYSDGELKPLLEFSGAKAVICAPADAKRDRPLEMDLLRDRLPELAHIIVARGRAAGAQFLRMDDMIATGADTAVPDGPGAGDAALLCFTSGTSSAPKAVVHASETLLADARAYVKTIAVTGQDHSMIAPPFTHIFGLECVNNALCVGGSVVPLDQFTARNFVGMIERCRPTIVYAAPAHLAASLSDRELDGRDLASVRQVILGGSICPPVVAREFEGFLPNGRVGILFGMTESLLVTQTRYDASAAERHGTVGQPVPGIEVRIVDPDGNLVGVDEEGELQLRGFTIMSGYLRNDAANEKSFTADGWFRSGDTAIKDSHGNIAITGRSSDIINRGGIKINPADVEAAICEHPDILQAALIPMPDPILGEKICAVLVTRKSRPITVSELSTFLTELRITKIRHPEHIVVVEEMPMTPTRKIIKKQLVNLVFPTV